MGYITEIDSRALSDPKFSRKTRSRKQLTVDLLVTVPWSPFLVSNQYLKESNFVSCDLLVLDVDEGFTLEAAKLTFAPYKHIIATTKSHQKEKNGKPAVDRFRVILFFDQPITNIVQYKQNWIRYVVHHFALKGKIDPLTDAARFYYPCVRLISQNELGDTLPVAPLVSVDGVAKEIQQGRDNEFRGKLLSKTRAFLACEKDDSGASWHKRFIAAAIDLREQGYPEEEAALQLRRASPQLELDETDLAQLHDVYVNERGGALEARIDWPDMQPRSGGSFVPTPDSPANMRYMLESLMSLRFSFNTRTQLVIKEDGSALSDADLSRAYLSACSYKLAKDKTLIEGVMIQMAKEHEVDPLKRAIEATKWDGEDHIAALLDTLTLDDNSRRPIYLLFLRRWLIGVVTKIYHPGEENNVLTFYGPQAAGKSRWLKKLASIWPDGFGEGHIDPNNKDHELRHIDNFIWHVAELDYTTSSRDVGALKDYFTKSRVNVRRPYARYAVVADSVCSFCASVNSASFLHDTSGNRRYLIIPIKEANPEHKVDIAQVFAQAYAAMLAGERQWFSREEIVEVNSNNEVFRFKDDLTMRIEANVVSGLDPLTFTDIVRLLGFGHEAQMTKAARSSFETLLVSKGIKRANRGGIRIYLVDASKIRGQSKKIKEVLT